jgi:hypothetical protein
MIIVRLQTVLSREVTPGDTAVLTVGSVQAGTRSNLIPDHAVLQLNMRSFSQPTRQRMLAAIQRIVRGECRATCSPRDPDFETLTSFPLTDNDAATTDRVAAAFAKHFGDRALELDRQTVSKDFSEIPDAAHVPYTYWGIGRTDREVYLAAEKEGRLQDLPSNHSPNSCPRCSPPPCAPAPRPWSRQLWPGSRRSDGFNQELEMRTRKHPMTPLAAIVAGRTPSTGCPSARRSGPPATSSRLRPGCASRSGNMTLRHWPRT